ncbi:MAG: hypothetical protein RLZZ528_2910 [Pseudomonadota bacterium]
MRGAARTSLVAALASWPLAAPGAEVTALPAFDWTPGIEGFGGISDLIVTAHGAGFVAVSDRGTIYQGRIARRAGDGAVTALTVTDSLRPHDTTGREVSGFRQDAEDLALGPDGEVVVAFEGLARLTAFRPPDPTPRPTHPWDQFRDLWGNEGFEALSPLPGGGLVAIAESARDGAYMTFVRQKDGWQAGPPIPGADGYAASGADLGPDGMLYLLERTFGLVSGFEARVRRMRPTGADWAEVAPVDLPEEALGQNFEGISLWQDGSGGLWLTLVSDNNFRAGEPTVMQEFRLSP